MKKAPRSKIPSEKNTKGGFTICVYTFKAQYFIKETILKLIAECCFYLRFFIFQYGKNIVLLEMITAIET